MVAGFLTILGFGVLIWILLKTIKNQPELFSSENLSKSFTLMGVLALLLIVSIGFVVLMLRQ